MSIEALAQDIRKRKIQRSTEVSIEQKILDGSECFYMSCQFAKAGIRVDFPDANEEEIHQKLIERLYGKR